MKCLHRAFLEALADEGNCSFEGGVLHIRDWALRPEDIVEMAKQIDGSNPVFDDLFSGWLADWKELQCEEADRILEQYDQHDRFQRLVAAYTKGVLTPFVGAGLSIPSGYLGWSAFLYKIQRDSLVSQEKIEAMLSDGFYEDAAQLLADTLGPSFDECIENQFAIDRPIEGAVALLPHIFSGMVVTTNFDTVLERSFQDADVAFKEILCGAESVRFRITSTEHPHMLLKLHGKADTSQGRILTLREYNTHYADASVLTNTVKLLYDRNHLLFLGCSLSGDRLLSAFKDYVASQGHDNLLKHYAFLPSPESHPQRVTRREQLASYHIYPIWYPPETHDESITALLIKLHKDAQ